MNRLQTATDQTSSFGARHEQGHEYKERREEETRKNHEGKEGGEKREEEKQVAGAPLYKPPLVPAGGG